MVQEKKPTRCSLETLCMKLKQKTYNTEQSIIKEIDALKSRQSELLIESEQQELDGNRFVRTGNKDDVEEGKWLLEQACRGRKAVARCDAKLLKFKDALAEFRTETFPAIVPDKMDRQVVLK